MNLVPPYEYQDSINFLENVREILRDILKKEDIVIDKKAIRLPAKIRNLAYQIAYPKKRLIKDPMTLQECVFSILGISEKSFEEILYITSDQYTDEKMANAQMYAAQELPLKSERKEIIEECVFFIETEFENILHYYKTILKEATNYIIANKISKYGDFKEEITLVNPIEVVKWATLHFSVDKDLLPYTEKCLKQICTQGKESTIHQTLSIADSKYIKKEGGSAKESSKITATNNAAQLILDHISNYLDSAGKIGKDMFCRLVEQSMAAKGNAHSYQPTACRTFFKEKMPPVYKRERGRKISR